MPNQYSKISTADRFWQKVEKSKDTDACWDWKSTVSRYGYGYFMLNGKRKHAHRMALELGGAQLNPSIFVCHTCDNRLCCNPAHLWLGDNASNMADAARKGRIIKPASQIQWGHAALRAKIAAGLPGPRAKFSPEDIQAIRAERTAGKKVTAIAVDRCVDRSTIDRILRGKNYGQVK